jgi:biotin transport system substrate-specific component
MEAIGKTSKISKIIKLALIIIVGSILLTISAKIKIPFYPVPMTMQTFMVLFFGLAFGYKIGLTIVSLYLLEGIIGLPVFANTPEKGIGLTYFIGPTMGYLIGFLIAVYFAGIRRDWLIWSNYQLLNSLTIFTRLIFSVSFIYILGLLWLGTLIGWDKPIYKLGAEPFLLAELFKITLLTILYPWIKKINKFI